jgi:hypothetical protein
LPGLVIELLPVFSVVFNTPAPILVLIGLLDSQILWCLYDIEFTEFLILLTPEEKSLDFSVFTMLVDWRLKSL